MKVQDIMANMLSSNKTSAITSYFSVSGKSSTGFSSVMSNAGAAVKTNKMASAGKKQQSYGKQAGSAKNNTISAKVSSSAKPGKGMQTGLAKTGDAAKISDGKEFLTETEKLLTGTKEDFEEAVELIGNAIMEILGEDLQIGDEELNRAMEVLGLSCMDLFQTDNLKQFVMELQGASDITEALMDDDLSTMLTQALQDITTENIAQQVGMSEQDVEQLIQTMLEQKSVPVMQEELVTEETIITQAIQGNEQPETVNQKNNADLAMEQNKAVANQEEKEDAQSSLPDVSVVKTVSEEKGSLSKEDFGRNMPKQSDLAETMVDNIAASTVTETVSADGTMTMTTVEVRRVIIQIVQQIKVVIRSEQTDMHMTLHPEHLGRLQLAVSSKDGIMTANFVVQNEMVRHALETQMQELKDAFAEQGLKVEAVEVTVSTFEFAQGDQAGESGKQPEQKKQRGKTIDMESAFLDEVDLEESENKAAAAISGSGNNVDYIA